ncbi:Aspartate aminotransferase [Kluyveromyces marxianus]
MNSSAIAKMKIPIGNASSVLSRVSMAAPDKILGLTEKFNVDRNPNKINLTVGIYKDEAGIVTTFPSVSRAQAMLDSHLDLNNDLSYLPITGSQEFQNNVLNFLFRESSDGNELLDEYRITFVQTLSGTGALAVVSKLLSTFVSKTVWIPNPSWANHANVFKWNGFKQIKYYTYYENGKLNVDKWLSDLQSSYTAEKDDENWPPCIVLHACCHNPTGVDPTLEQWQRILPVIHDMGIIPIVDMAYQGMESGNLVQDAYLLRMCLEYEWENGLYLCQSFAKNMGLYGERVGSLSVVVPPNPKDLKARLDSQLKKIVRGIYSSPPGYGSRVANLVLSNPDLKRQWFVDVKAMSDRLWGVRNLMHERLNWPNLVNFETQHGMFYYTGLSPQQVQKLQDQYGIYLTQDGRMSLSGVNDGNIDYLCNSLLDVVE